jgi:outer membrane protein assembly factor BamB
MTHLFRIAALGTLLLSVLASPTQAQQWTRFRGPNGTGLSEARTVPVTWTDEDFNWRVELPGIGHSAPVIWGEKIFLTSAEEEGAKRHTICLSTKNGQIQWSREYEARQHKKHARNSFASPTCAVDADHVYAVWSDPEQYALVALDHYGTEVWRRDLGAFFSQHSCGTSPIVYENMVILGNDQDKPGESFLIAVDRKTGEDIWRTPRESARVAYSTPCVYEPSDGPAQLIFNSMAHGITGVDPKTGGVLWEIGAVFDKRSVSSPIVVGDHIFGSCGSGAGGNYLVAVKPGNDAQDVKPSEAFRVDRQAPYVPTPVAKGDLVFLFSDNGIVTCINGLSGDRLWQKRVGGNFSGSPICVANAVYCINDAGEVVVIEASDQCKLLGTNPLGEDSRSTPAVADGVMYLRTNSHLISIGGKSDAKQ